MRLLVVLLFLGLSSAFAEESALDPGDHGEEMVHLKAVGQNPASAAPHQAYAEFLADHGRMRAAISQWQTAERLEPANGAIANSLGGVYLRIGRAEESAREFQRAIGTASNVAAYHYNLANVEFMLRHELTAAWHIETAELLNRALAEFRAARDLAPNDLEYARSYAESFYALVDPDWAAAEAAWKHVLVISPQGDFAYLQLARVSLKRGDKAQARLFLEQVKDARHDGLKRKLRAAADGS